MYTASWSVILKASSKTALAKLPVTWSLPMPSAMVSYLEQNKDKKSDRRTRGSYVKKRANLTMEAL